MARFYAEVTCPEDRSMHWLFSGSFGRLAEYRRHGRCCTTGYGVRLGTTHFIRGWAGVLCIYEVVGLTDQTLSCKPHYRASGRAARRLPRCTRSWRWAPASGVTPSVSRGTSRLGRRARHSAACRLLRRVSRPRQTQRLLVQLSPRARSDFWRSQHLDLARARVHPTWRRTKPHSDTIATTKNGTRVPGLTRRAHSIPCGRGLCLAKAARPTSERYRNSRPGFNK